MQSYENRLCSEVAADTNTHTYTHAQTCTNTRTHRDMVNG